MASNNVRLLLDQGLPRDAASELRRVGFDCTHVGELGLSKATDPEILTLSRDMGSVVVTLDADFHTILAVSGAANPSVIRIRLEGLGGIEVATVIRKVVNKYAVDLRRGCMITVKQHKTTCRLLPGPL